MNLDDILKSSKLGQKTHDDERLGRFSAMGGPWQLRTTIDLPFQADVPIYFQLEQDALSLPESMPKNIIWIQDNLGEIWNTAAGMINTFIEAEGISTPEKFSLLDLSAYLPDAPLNATDWRLEVGLDDMAIAFELTFHGRNVIKCNAV
jgi:hypothetical protein